MVSAVFERYKTIEECDLLNLGGLGDIRKITYQSSIDGESYHLIQPPFTHPGGLKEPEVHKIEFNKKWTDQLDYRLGTLKLYVNGYLFFVIENFEEIIPRELNTEKEKQVGVPFNISFGGGTQGLHDHLIFSGCSNPYGPYTQDPELFPNNILSATTLSGISTNILLEENFGGTFMGGISQFRMYVEPLGSPQIQHNFRILKNKFDLFNYWCPNCYTNYLIDNEGNQLVDNYGNYLVYCADGSEVDSVEVLNLNFMVVVSSGSVITDITVMNDKPVLDHASVDYHILLDTVDDNPIDLMGCLVIPMGEMSASTCVVIDDDYNRLKDVLINEPVVNMGDYNIIVNRRLERDIIIYNNEPNPTPTPTIEITPTPTPTITTTPTIEITPTPTPTITPTPTPTMVPLVSEVIYGKLNKLTINENDVVQFNKLKTNDVLSTYVHYDAIPGYCYMLVPITDNQPTLFRNSNESCGGFVIPFLKLNDITIIDSNEKVIIYCVYRSFVSTKASVDVWVCE
jgi:hypothetical protein